MNFQTHTKGTKTALNKPHQNLNELLDEHSIPLEVADCYIGSISAVVPWSSIFSDNSVLDVSNLELTIKYKPRTETHSQWMVYWWCVWDCTGGVCRGVLGGIISIPTNKQTKP